MRSRHVPCGCAAALFAICLAGAADAATINVVGLFPGKAVVAVDGAAPRSVAVGETIAGVKLLSIEANGATFLVEGRRQSIAMGSYLASRQSGAGRASVVLNQDARGHYVADGSINGATMRFLVDTGASLIVLSRADARRLNIDLSNAVLSQASTANGVVPYRVVKLDRVRIGDVEMTNVDAGILENYDGPALLGMSFLSRTDVSRDGANMVLTRRY